jgi:outer membrane PBP1 activator LpoA protein
VFDKIYLCVGGLLVAIIVTLFIQNKWLKSDLSTLEQKKLACEAQVTFQNAQIDSFKKQSDALEDKIKRTEVDILAMKKEHQKSIDAIIKSDVPKDCLKAVEWAVQQAN